MDLKEAVRYARAYRIACERGGYEPSWAVWFLEALERAARTILRVQIENMTGWPSDLIREIDEIAVVLSDAGLLVPRWEVVPVGEFGGYDITRDGHPIGNFPKRDDAERVLALLQKEDQ